MKKIKKFIVFFSLASIMLSFFSGCGLKETPPPRIESLEIWGVWDDSDLMNSLIKKYLDSNPQVNNIEYRKFTIDEYENDLTNAMARDKGPDIFLAHHTWVTSKLDLMISEQSSREVYNNYVMSQSGCSKPTTIDAPLITLRNIEDTFVSAVYDDFVFQGRVMGIPLSMDTMALYYNEDLFNEVGLAYAPNTWEDFEKYSRKLTKIDENGNITQAGSAFGTSNNVNRASDILSMLMLQKGSEITEFGSVKITEKIQSTNSGNLTNPGVEAMEFYTSFSDATNPNYTWNPRMHNSIDAFQEGKVAMMINYTYALDTIKEKAPKLNFKVAEIPQFKDTKPEYKITYPNYWGYVVSRDTLEKSSLHSIEAWKFLRFLASEDQARIYYEATKDPPVRRDIIDEKKNEPILGVFAEQSLKAKSWYQPENNEIEKIFNNNIDDVALNRKSVNEALEEMETKLNIIFNKNEKFLETYLQ